MNTSLIQSYKGQRNEFLNGIIFLKIFINQPKLTKLMMVGDAW